jgi:hypothetical protein
MWAKHLKSIFEAVAVTLIISILKDARPDAFSAGQQAGRRTTLSGLQLREQEFMLLIQKRFQTLCGISENVQMQLTRKRYKTSMLFICASS